GSWISHSRTSRTAASQFRRSSDFLTFCPWTLPSAQIGQRQPLLRRDVNLQACWWRRKIVITKTRIARNPHAHPAYLIYCGKEIIYTGGGRGIRTPERVTPLTVFKTA